MSEPFPCTTCGAMLRLAPGASAGRCPNCKTVFSVAQSPPPPPPSGPVSGAPPLPFGRTAKQAQPVSGGKLPSAPQTSRGPTIRAKVVKDDPFEVPEDADDETRAEAERRRKVREELRDMERAKEREERKLDQLAEHCHTGRIAVQILAAAVGLHALAASFQGLSLMGAGLKNHRMESICGIVALSAGLLTAFTHMIGFGFAVAGPRIARHIGWIGIVICIVHASLAGVQFSRPQPKEVELNLHWKECLPIQDHQGSATSLPLLSDHASRFFNGYEHSYWGLGVAAFEFTRFVLVCMLLQAYASGGKSPELGYRTMRGISRVFFLILLTCSFRLAMSSGFDWVSPADFMFQIGMAVQGCLTTAFYVCFALFCLLQIQNTLDVVTVVDYKRFADKRSDLDR